MHDPPVRSCTRSTTPWMDASSFRKRTAYALGASDDEDLTGANSGSKLMRQTGVGSGLLNRSPKCVSKWIVRAHTLTLHGAVHPTCTLCVGRREQKDAELVYSFP